MAGQEAHPTVRRGGPDDLQAVAAIQRRCPEASQWNPADYLPYDLRVATVEGTVAGFLVARCATTDECEILNLAVAPDFRRKGVARALVAAVLQGFLGTVFLELRESNKKALQAYKHLGFQTVSIRPEYYQSPLESAIVMKFHSC